MHYTVTKMDNRYTKYGHRYLIEFRKTNDFQSGRGGTGVLDFDRCRRWFNTNFGWSQDVDTRQAMQVNRKDHPDCYQDSDINAVWAYAVRYGDYRIYVADDKTLSWFMLCHPKSS